MLFRFLEAVFLVIALSLDAFVASAAFGAQGIRVPTPSVVVISVICSATLGASLLLGSLVSPFFSQQTAARLSCFMLSLLGVLRLFDSMIKAWIKKSCGDTADVEFRFLSFHFLLRVYADSTQADANRSHSLSAGEAASLALALSLDGLATGFGAGIAGVSAGMLVTLSLLMGMATVKIGLETGRRVASSCTMDLSWLGGAMLIVLGLAKLR